jgi:hypothetical protein
LDAASVNSAESDIKVRRVPSPGGTAGDKFERWAGALAIGREQHEMDAVLAQAAAIAVLQGTCGFVGDAVAMCDEVHLSTGHRAA